MPSEAVNAWNLIASAKTLLETCRRAHAFFMPDRKPNRLTDRLPKDRPVTDADIRAAMTDDIVQLGKEWEEMEKTLASAIALAEGKVE